MNTDVEQRQMKQRPDWQELTPIVYVPTNCPVCQSDRGRLKYTKQIRDIEMRFHICEACGLLYANPRATAESLRNIYASADFFEGGKPGDEHLNYFSFIGGEKYLRRTARGRVRRIQKFCKSGKLLEVASAAGFFLVEAKNAGFDVSGVEFSAPMAAWASQQWGVPVTAESIELVDLPPEQYDVIASWGVMTIIQDPVALMRKFHRALKPGGVWAFNTYYHDGLWARMVGGRWQILVVNFSQIYTKQLILDLAAREGFRLVSRRRDCPHTDLTKLADQLAQVFGGRWLARALQKSGIGNLMIQIPLPDVLEYIFVKEDQPAGGR